MAFATIALTACSTGSKPTPTPTPDPLPNVAQQTTPVEPPAVQPPVKTDTKTASNPIPIDPPKSNPTPVKAPAKPATPSTKLVLIQNFGFKPAVLTIKKGDTVKWENKDSTAHTVTSDTFKSDQINQNTFFSYTFTKAGNYNYHCIIHPSMTGSVIVNP